MGTVRFEELFNGYPCKAKDAVLQFKFTPDSVNVLGYYSEYVIVRGLENLDSNR